jgi:[ribosomal protein S18]-alanine N-acetyltransferase
VGETATITIDGMILDDLDQVIAIEQASFSMPWSRNLFLSEFRNHNVSLMLVARGAGAVRTVLGYIVCWIVTDELHILDLATLPHVRQQGIARRLVLAAIGQGYKRRVRRAFLEVRASNEAALALYSGLGFTRSMVRQGYYDMPIEDAVVMSIEGEALSSLLSWPAEGRNVGN